ncbi:MAG: hypothetical protein M1830_007853 [Pleopsidium flavum]|nr:MAG: hypothetical protein M1830_007853 [Pleopsidium flavum]
MSDERVYKKILPIGLALPINTSGPMGCGNDKVKVIPMGAALAVLHQFIVRVINIKRKVAIATTIELSADKSHSQSD